MEGFGFDFGISEPGNTVMNLMAMEDTYNDDDEIRYMNATSRSIWYGDDPDFSFEDEDN